jgi:hypothetical protein
MTTPNPALERLNQISLGFMEAKILLAGAQLRVFDALKGAGASARQVCELLTAEQRGTEILLDALVAMGVLVKSRGIYRNHPDYEPFLLEDAPSHFTAGARHRNRLFRHWAFLEERVLGRPRPDFLDDAAALTDAEHNENFIRAMYAYSGTSAAEVVRRIDLTGVRTLADLGGGPGHYLVEFLRQSPAIEPYLVDLPLTLAVARRIQADSPEAGRIHFVEWDFYESEAPEGLPRFDLVFLSQVIHSESPEANRRLFRRLLPHVNPGGRVVVHERIVDPDRTTPKDGAIFAVNMLAMSDGGRTFTEEEVLAWAEQAGFVRLAGLRINDRSHLVMFHRP